MALSLAVILLIGSVLTFGLPLIVIAAYYLLFGRRQRHIWRFRRLVDALRSGHGVRRDVQEAEAWTAAAHA
ncbi:MAG TPA: hypothetical protein VFF76_01120 [Holophagaceae bacterium]|jgi:hypothetical protein|nr:hypothetical protein [Holophagaceae bacterium]